MMKKTSVSLVRQLLAVFISVLILILVASVIIYTSLSSNSRLLNSMVEVYSPSAQALNKLGHELRETKMLIKNWAFVSAKSNTQDKVRLRQLHNHNIPDALEQLQQLSKHWTEEERVQLQRIRYSVVDSLLPAQTEVMNMLSTFDAYQDPMMLFRAQSMVEEENDRVMHFANRSISMLDTFTEAISKQLQRVEQQLNKSVRMFRVYLFFIIFSIVLGVILLSRYILRYVIRPLAVLQQAAATIKHDSLDVNVPVVRNDEIGRLSMSFNEMVASIKRHRDELNALNQQLMLSERSLKASNQTKDKFFNIIAHDLRGPFRSFLNVTELLSTDAASVPPERLQRFHTSLNETALALESLLENLLQWARAQGGTLDVNIANVNAYEMVKQIAEVYHINAHEKGVEIVNEIPKEVMVAADYNLLHTIFRNLIANAMKFSPKEAKVVVKVHQRYADKIAFCVCDDGIGIAPEDIDKLFRIDVDTKTIGESTEKGTGFGLILCKEFVEKQGGEISVESELHKGSSFIFSLPLEHKHTKKRTEK